MVYLRDHAQSQLSWLWTYEYRELARSTARLRDYFPGEFFSSRLIVIIGGVGSGMLTDALKQNDRIAFFGRPLSLIPYS